MLASWKRPIRNALKHSKALVKGYPFYYAGQQEPQPQEPYPHLWHEATTPIPDRGTPEIRQNRLWNLHLAAQKLDYLQIPPGRIVSFCHRVGEPTLRNGFRAGPVFVQGQVRTDVGGGLCLLATSLFQAFLWAGWEILERHCHSIDAYGEGRFYPLGQDAAVAYGYKDLMVRNVWAVPLQLRLQVLPAQGVVASSVWGRSPCPVAVKVESQVLARLAPSSEAGVPGWQVETRRYLRDRLSEREQGWTLDYQTTSLYHPCDRP
ncbi:VanW family protein [Geitlerinema sp. PCC 7407]|uniref:VanW family protein n=1 Tax=Geitlerinema sp. PCC 7407 TaxID=1173025 RepID=UPI00029FC977|nr:VanW family protein [Geitlerinema sp. PCC 7407]AFY65749.1 VanW family protein [Geitlerinema sp. PCC 7407]